MEWEYREPIATELAGYPAENHKLRGIWGNATDSIQTQAHKTRLPVMESRLYLPQAFPN